MNEINWQVLFQQAQKARENAYAPYSKFYVGAVIMAQDGRIFRGANVENSSYGLTICAERTAIFSAVIAGARQFSAMVVCTSSERAVPPCGACRQVMLEFPPSFIVRSMADTGQHLEYDVASLLPHGFANDYLTDV